MITAIKSITNIFVNSIKNYLRIIEFKRMASDLDIQGPIILYFDDIKSISIGAGVSIGAFSELVIIMKSQFSSVSGSLIIEDGVLIGGRANIRAGGGAIVLKKNALIAQNVSLIASNHGMSDSLPYRYLPWDTTRTGVVIGENVWLGNNVTVLPGCSVGTSAIVAAGAVVVCDIPSKQLWGGVPARHIRDL